MMRTLFATTTATVAAAARPCALGGYAWQSKRQVNAISMVHATARRLRRLPT